ncbi:hypothetical protein [Lysobacter terrae]
MKYIVKVRVALPTHSPHWCVISSPPETIAISLLVSNLITSPHRWAKAFEEAIAEIADVAAFVIDECKNANEERIYTARNVLDFAWGQLSHNQFSV